MHPNKINFKALQGFLHEQIFCSLRPCCKGTHKETNQPPAFWESALVSLLSMLYQSSEKKTILFPKNTKFISY